MANKNKKGEKVQVVRCGEIFRNHLRPMRGFYGAYLFSKSANSNFKILIDCSFLRDDFENRFLKNYLISTTKNVGNILQ